VDGVAEVRVNFGSQPFRCTQFNYLEHGFGRSLQVPPGANIRLHNDDDDDGIVFRNSSSGSSHSTAIVTVPSAGQLSDEKHD
jgi:hypothetical protein